MEDNKGLMPDQEKQGGSGAPDDGDGTNSLQSRIAALDIKKWKLIQLIIGAVLGLGAAACLFFIKESATFKSMNLLLAVVIALIGPRVVEKQVKRDFRFGRLMMAVFMAVALVIYFVYTFVILKTPLTLS